MTMRILLQSHAEIICVFGYVFFIGKAPGQKKLSTAAI